MPAERPRASLGIVHTGPPGLRKRTLWYQEVAPFGARPRLPGCPVAGEAVANALRYGSEREGTERRALARPVEKDLVDERLLTCCVAPGVSGKTACAVLSSGEAVARGREFGEPPLSPAGPWPGGPLGTSVLSPGGGF